MSGKQQGGDNTESWVIIAFIALFAAIYLIDKFFPVFAEVWRWVRIVQFYPLSFIPESLPFIGELDFKGFVNYLMATPGELISSEFVTDVDHYYWRFISWIPGLFLVFLGFKLVSKTDNVSRTYDMESLLVDRAPNYPFVQKFLDVHPEHADVILERGNKKAKDLAAAVSPEMFAKMAPPMGLERLAKKDKILRKSSIWDGDIGFDYDLAEKSFAAQLGKKYEGLGSLSTTEKRLYEELKTRIVCPLSVASEFMKKVVPAHVKGKKPAGLVSNTEKELSEAIKQFMAVKSKGRKGVPAREMTKKAFFLSMYKDPGLKKLFISNYCEKIMGNHAYIRTGLMSLLEESRNAGVVASLEFRHWLKGEDRILWYCVSSVGRKVSFVECGGVFSQWLVEKELSRPVPQVFVDEAVTALREAIKIDQRIQKKEEQEQQAGL